MTVLVVGLSERQSLRWLSDAVQADVEPRLTTRELRDLMTVAAVTDVDGNLPDRFDRWEANEVYAVGDRVVPATRNGYVYKATAVTTGQSGSTAPTFLTTLAATFTDGGVTWTVEDTAGWVPTYDAMRLNRSAAEGWRMKKGKRMDLLSISGGDTTVSPTTWWQACDNMIKFYASKGGAGTLDLSGSAYRGVWSPVELVTS